jgi:hypothetical protein
VSFGRNATTGVSGCEEAVPAESAEEEDWVSAAGMVRTKWSKLRNKVHEGWSGVLREEEEGDETGGAKDDPLREV